VDDVVAGATASPGVPWPRGLGQFVTGMGPSMSLGRGVRLVSLLAVSALFGACQLATSATSSAPAPLGASVTPRSAAAHATPAPTAHAGSTLSGLTILVPAGTGGGLTPAFSPYLTDYSINVDGDISAVGIVPTVADPKAVRIAVAGGSTSTGKITMVGVGVGSSQIAVEVSAADGSPSTTYMVDVVREDIGPVVDKFRKLTYADPATGETMGYRLFVPDNYDPARSYPLVLFLHGSGERGSDNEAQLTANQGATIWATPEEQAKHPAFVLAPQSGFDTRTQGWTSLSTHGQNDPFRPQRELGTAYDILEKVRGEFNIDKGRIYVTGVSMGGFGTYTLAIAHPTEFAAIVPICGGGDPARLATIAKLPIWIFHAAKDPTVGVGFSRNSVAALKKAGGHPRYTEYPASAYFYPTAHYSWTSAYANAEMRDWLFEQSR
jgi:dienelactone hydrolase